MLVARRAGFAGSDRRSCGLFRSTRGARISGALVYSPRLTVEAEVECGHGVLHRVAPVTVSGPRYSAEELAAALASGGRVIADAAGLL